MLRSFKCLSSRQAFRLKFSIHRFSSPWVTDSPLPPHLPLFDLLKHFYIILITHARWRPKHVVVTFWREDRFSYACGLNWISHASNPTVVCLSVAPQDNLKELGVPVKRSPSCSNSIRFAYLPLCYACCIVQLRTSDNWKLFQQSGNVFLAYPLLISASRSENQFNVSVVLRAVLVWLGTRDILVPHIDTVASRTDLGCIDWPSWLSAPVYISVRWRVSLCICR
jgi:hypothetical protein